MGYFGSNRVDIFEIYKRYCDIVSKNEFASSKEALAQLLKLVDSRVHISDRDSIFYDLLELMPHLDLMVDSCRFARFYDFVFLVCRENGQKNITVSRAVAAWRIVLAGRFRLLNQWCDFVEENQRHNISEDTWQQVLAFSRCVREDLEGYDPKGAWPVIIDDFVEHMYRITRSNNCSTRSFGCKCGDPESQQCISDDSLPGLKIVSGSKRKSFMDISEHGFEPLNHLLPYSIESKVLSNCKRTRHICLADKMVNLEVNPVGNSSDDMEIVKNNSPLGSLNNSPCAIEGSLSKGFAGLLSTSGSFLESDQKRRVSFT